MNSNNYYLLEDSTKTQEMIINIRNLLFSNEASNLNLAIQLLKGGGVPDNLMTLVLGFSKWHSDSTILKEFMQLFKKFASDNLQSYTNKNWERYIKANNDESSLSFGIQLMGKHDEINTYDLANICLELTKRGGKFCLENQTDSYYNILSKIIHHNTLNLTNYSLNFLPEEIGDFPTITALYLGGNSFTELPQTAKKIIHLNTITYENTPLPKEHLEEFFPHLFYQEYYNEGCNLKSGRKYLEAEKLFRKSAELKPDYAESWHNIGASLIFAKKIEEAEEPLREAIKHYENRIQIDPNSAWDWFWKSCVYALLGEKEESFKDLKTCIKIDSYYKRKARNEEDYRNYFDDEDFQAIVNS